MADLGVAVLASGGANDSSDGGAFTTLMGVSAASAVVGLTSTILCVRAQRRHREWRETVRFGDKVILQEPMDAIDEPPQCTRRDVFTPACRIEVTKLVQRALIHSNRAEYDIAVQTITAAYRITPHPILLLRRAEIYTAWAMDICGDIREDDVDLCNVSIVSALEDLDSYQSLQSGASGDQNATIGKRIADLKSMWRTVKERYPERGSR